MLYGCQGCLAGLRGTAGLAARWRHVQGSTHVGLAFPDAASANLQSQGKDPSGWPSADSIQFTRSQTSVVFHASGIWFSHMGALAPHGRAQMFVMATACTVHSGHGQDGGARAATEARAGC